MGLAVVLGCAGYDVDSGVIGSSLMVDVVFLRSDQLGVWGPCVPQCGVDLWCLMAPENSSVFWATRLLGVYPVGLHSSQGVDLR